MPEPSSPKTTTNVSPQVDPKKKKVTRKPESTVKSTSQEKQMSAGQRMYEFASDVREDYDVYMAGIADAQRRTKKRSAWSLVGGILGAGVGLMLAPAIIGGAAAAAGVSALGSVATGAVTGTAVAVGSAAGSKVGKERAGQKARSVDTEKFYKAEAAQATEAFTQAEEDIASSGWKQAATSGVLAGLQAGGAFKKMGELGKKGLGIGQKETGPVFSAEGADVLEDIYALSEAGPGKYGAGSLETPYAHALSNVDKEVLAQSIANPLQTTATATSSLGNLSNASLSQTLSSSLYRTLGKNVGSAALQQSVGYASRYLGSTGGAEPPNIAYDPNKYYQT